MASAGRAPQRALEQRHAPAVQHPHTSADTANQSAEPAQTSAAEEQIGNRLLS
jgi:hypothetical protein